MVDAVDEAPRARRPLLFLALVMALSIPFYFVVRVSMFPAGMMFFPLSALMVWVPFAVAVGLTAQERGWGAVGKLLARAFDVRRVRPAWMAVIFCLMPLVMFVAYSLANVTGPPLPPQRQLWEAPLFNITLFLFLLFPFAIAEEIGWTAYATDPLMERWGALGASVVIGLVWQLWHVVPHLELGRAPEWIVWHSIVGVLLRIVIVWAYRNTASVFAAEILHAMFNISYRTFPKDGALYDPVATAAVLFAVVLFVLGVWGLRLIRKGSPAAVA